MLVKKEPKKKQKKSRKKPNSAEPLAECSGRVKKMPKPKLRNSCKTFCATLRHSKVSQ